MNNLYLEMNDDELFEIYLLYKNELRRTGICASQPLRGILDKYFEFYGANCLIASEVDLLFAAAERWMGLKKHIEHCNVSYVG